MQRLRLCQVFHVWRKYRSLNSSNLLPTSLSSHLELGPFRCFTNPRWFYSEHCPHRAGYMLDTFSVPRYDTGDVLVSVIQELRKVHRFRFVYLMPISHIYESCLNIRVFFFYQGLRSRTISSLIFPCWLEISGIYSLVTIRPLGRLMIHVRSLLSSLHLHDL